MEKEFEENVDCGVSPFIFNFMENGESLLDGVLRGLVMRKGFAGEDGMERLDCSLVGDAMFAVEGEGLYLWTSETLQMSW